MPFQDPASRSVQRLRVPYPEGCLNLEFTVKSGRIEDYLGFGARANAKRAFLFVSKVLGKHHPVLPSRMLQIHEQLARQLNVITGPVLFIDYEQYLGNPNPAVERRAVR